MERSVKEPCLFVRRSVFRYAALPERWNVKKDRRRCHKTCYSDAVSYFKQSISDVFGKDAEKVSNKIFYENANNIFKPSSKPSIAKNAIIAFAGIAFLAAICKLASGNNKRESVWQN